MRRQIQIIFLCYLAAGVSAQSRTYTSAKYGYSFVAPPGWRTDPGYDGSSPYIYNYRRSEAAAAAPLLPVGGAGIRIIAAADFLGKYVKNFEEWIRWRSRAGQEEVARRDFPCQASGDHRAHVCTEVRGVTETGESPLVEVSLYFTLDGKYFCAFVDYYETDPKVKSYENILRSVVNSITAGSQ